MATTPPQRRLPVIVLVGCGLVAACLCLTGVAAGAYFYLRGRQATSAEPTIEYVLDASPRMDSPSSGGEPRIVVARGVLAEIVRTADPRLTAGLRVFGTGALPQGCEDTDLIVPLAASNQGEIEGTLGNVEASPESDSAVAQAMVGAIRDMASTDGPHSIVVVTGGADLCNPEAGELIRQEAQRAGIELRLFVIGFEVPPDEVEAVKAFVELIPGATYTDAPQAEALRSALAGIQTEVDRMAEEALAPRPEPGGFTSAHACDHPYFPLRTGATWTYAATDGTLTWNVTSAGGSAESASATMGFSFPGGTTTVHWGCGAEGITSYDFGSFSGAGFDDAISFEIVDASGAWFPDPERMVPGYSWSNEYTMNVASAFEGASFSMSSATSQSWTVTGIETVSFGGEERNALRIDGTSTTTTTAADLPIPIPTMTSSETFWMVEGVGIVRFSTSGEGYSSSGELTSYSIP
jgi:hypothetical protein